MGCLISGVFVFFFSWKVESNQSFCFSTRFISDFCCVLGDPIKFLPDLGFFFYTACIVDPLTCWSLGHPHCQNLDRYHLIASTSHHVNQLILAVGSISYKMGGSDHFWCDRSGQQPDSVGWSHRLIFGMVIDLVITLIGWN